jgi:hypothetical protein
MTVGRTFTARRRPQPSPPCWMQWQSWRQGSQHREDGASSRTRHVLSSWLSLTVSWDAQRDTRRCCTNSIVRFTFDAAVCVRVCVYVHVLRCSRGSEHQPRTQRQHHCTVICVTHVVEAVQRWRLGGKPAALRGAAPRRVEQAGGARRRWWWEGRGEQALPLPPPTRRWGSYRRCTPQRSTAAEVQGRRRTLRSAAR